MNPTWIYVAAVYAGAVALARRAGAQLSWRITLFFYLFVLVFMFQPLVLNKVDIQVDYLRTLPPWKDTAPEIRPSNPWMNDVPLQLVPWAHQVRESWKSLRIPLWNANAGSGYPLLANAVSAATSPLRILALPLSLGHSFTAEAAWKILIALTFTFLYCRRRDYSPVASAFGAIVYGFSGFMIVWLHYPQATVACLAPAVLYAIDLLAEEVTYARFLLSVAIWWAITNGGHPETAAHCGFLALLAILWSATREGARRHTFFLASIGSVAVAALLSAPLLIPFFEGLTKSLRFAMLKTSPHPAGAFSDWASTIAMLQPHFFGAVPREDPWGPAIPETICGFTGTFAVAAAFIVLIYVVSRRQWRTREAFFVLTTVVTIAIVYSWPGITHLFNLAFGLAANTRLRFIFALMLALQAGAAVHLLQRGERRVWILGVFCALALIVAMIPFHFPSAAKQSASLLALVPGLLVLLVAAFAVPVRSRHGALLLLMVIATGELWNIVRGWNAPLPESAVFPETPMIRKLRALYANAREPVRFVGYGAELFPNIGGVFGFEDIRVNDAMAGSRYLGVLSVNAGLNTADYFMQWNFTETRILDYLNVRYLVMHPGGDPNDWRYKLVYDAPDGRIFENADALPRFFPVNAVILEFRWKEFVEKIAHHNGWGDIAILNDLKVENDQMRTDFLAPRPPNAPHATLQLKTYEPTEYTMRVNAPRYTLVVSSVPWWPGWKVVRNGKRIDPIRVNGAFVGFAVPAGASDVRVYYSPASFWTGVWLMVATLVGLAVASRLARRIA